MNVIDREELQRRHDSLVGMLEEQDRLASKGVIHQPVIVIGDTNRFSIGRESRVDSFCKIEIGEGMEIGNYVHIASFAHIGVGGGRTIIEDGAAVASGGKVISGSNQTESVSMSATAPKDLQSVNKSVTRLCRYSCVCTNAVVLPGVILCEGAVLAAGSVATKTIPPWEIWAGVPAKFLKKRER